MLTASEKLQFAVKLLLISKKDKGTVMQILSVQHLWMNLCRLNRMKCSRLIKWPSNIHKELPMLQKIGHFASLYITRKIPCRSGGPIKIAIQ